MVPAADPLIIALHVWGIIAPRTYHCLITLPDHYSGKAELREIQSVDLRLSHVAAIEYRYLLCIPNFGRRSYYDLAAAMARFGWTWPSRGNNASLFRDDRDLQKGIAQAERFAAERHESYQRKLALLRIHEEDGISVAALAEDLGVSKALIHGKIAAVRATQALRSRYPLPLPV